MNIKKMISTVDTHTAGEPTRVITGGLPHIPGKTMVEKKTWVQQNLDSLRKMLMWEPRGHQDMFGAVITAPTSDQADVGAIFMDSRGYLDMCGHGSIGMVTVLINTGMINMDFIGNGDIRKVVLDTPAGKVSAAALIKNNNAAEVTIQNVPSFFYETLEIDLPSVGRVGVDIAYGGNFFALVNVRELCMELSLTYLDRIKKLALEIRKIVNESITIQHPGTGEKQLVNLIEIYEESSPTKNMVVFGSGQVDRSPCGTGTCAKMACLYEKNRLVAGKPYEHVSILDTAFEGKIVGLTQVGEKRAIVPEITGQAYITGFHSFVSDSNDPFKNGFSLN